MSKSIWKSETTKSRVMMAPSLRCLVVVVVWYDVTHFLLATLVTSPLHTRLSLLVMMVGEFIVVNEAPWAAVNRSNGSWSAPLPLQGTMRTMQAANAHRAGWA